MSDDVFVKRRLRQLVRKELERTDLKAIVHEAIEGMDFQAIIHEALARTDLRALVQETLHERFNMSPTGPVQQPRVLH